MRVILKSLQNILLMPEFSLVVKSNIFFVFSLFLALAWYVVEPALAFLRLVHVFEGAATIVRGVNLLIVVAGFLYGVSRLKFRSDALVVVMLLMLLVGILSGVVNGHAWDVVVRHFYYWSFGFFIYLMAFNAGGIEFERTSVMVKGSLWLIWLTGLLSTFLFLYAGMQGDVYLGLGVGSFLLLLCFALVRGEYGKLLILLALIFLSGKRGVLVSALTVSAFYYVFVRARFFGESFVRLIVAGGAISLLGLLVSEYMAGIGVVDKLLSIFAFEYQSKDELLLGLEVASGGRLTEVFRGVESFSDYNFGYLFGAGFGFQYNWWSETGLWVYEDIAPVRYYLHFTPLNYLFQFGLPLTLFFYGLILSSLLKAYSYCKKHRDDCLALVFTLFVVAKVVQSFFGFLFVTDALFWLIFGVLMSRVYWQSRIE